MVTTVSVSKQIIDESIRRREEEECTNDGTLNRHGHRAMRRGTGRWDAGILILVNQGLATLAFFGVGVNLVVFLTRVMGDENAMAANKVSKWTGTVYIFSLLGAFLSDSYWGRYRTCVIFQLIFVFGLALLSFCTHIFLLNPSGCGSEKSPCKPHSATAKALFYVSIYLVALGNGGYQPNVATFGADQFDENSTTEAHSKVTFFSFFYLALNLGSLFSNTILVYFEDHGHWTIGFWAATVSAFAALVLFLAGTPRYRHLKANGNPVSRFCQVLVAAAKRWNMEFSSDDVDLCYYEVNHDGNNCSKNGGSGRKLLHTQGFKFLDRAALITKVELLESGIGKMVGKKTNNNPWSVCTLTQVEEVKCVLRLLPIWLCTILYSVVFTQMASLFVEQGAAMCTSVAGFHIPPASMSSSDILSVALFIYAYHHIIDPILARFRKSGKGGLTELERMGIGLIIAIAAMIVAGIVERFRLRYEIPGKGTSSMSIMWQIPQYVCIGASEVFMYVGQLEFFNDQAPDGLRSFGSALCMTSISVGNYVSILIVTTVTKFSSMGSGNELVGWIPARNLNEGHLDRFYFLLAVLTAVDFVVYLVTVKWYKCTKFEENQDTTPDHHLELM